MKPIKIGAFVLFLNATTKKPPFKFSWCHYPDWTCRPWKAEPLISEVPSSLPWPVWLSWLGSVPQSERSPVDSWLDSRTGHMPRLWVRSLGRASTRDSQLLFPSLPLSLKNNIQFFPSLRFYDFKETLSSNKDKYNGPESPYCCTSVWSPRYITRNPTVAWEGTITEPSSLPTPLGIIISLGIYRITEY